MKSFLPASLTFFVIGALTLAVLLSSGCRWRGQVGTPFGRAEIEVLGRFMAMEFPDEITAGGCPPAVASPKPGEASAK